MQRTHTVILVWIFSIFVHSEVGEALCEEVHLRMLS